MNIININNIKDDKGLNTTKCCIKFIKNIKCIMNVKEDYDDTEFSVTDAQPKYTLLACSRLSKRVNVSKIIDFVNKNHSGFVKGFYYSYNGTEAQIQWLIRNKRTDDKILNLNNKNCLYLKKYPYKESINDKDFNCKTLIEQNIDGDKLKEIKSLISNILKKCVNISSKGYKVKLEFGMNGIIVAHITECDLSIDLNKIQGIINSWIYKKQKFQSFNFAELFVVIEDKTLLIEFRQKRKRKRTASDDDYITDDEIRHKHKRIKRNDDDDDDED